MLKDFSLILRVALLASIATQAAFGAAVEPTKSFVYVGSDEGDNRVLQMYYHFDKIQKIDSKVTTLEIRKSERPLKNGQIIKNERGDISISANYSDGVLHVESTYIRASQGKKYKRRMVTLTYEVKVDPELTNDDLKLINGTYSHIPAE